MLWLYFHDWCLKLPEVIAKFCDLGGRFYLDQKCSPGLYWPHIGWAPGSKNLRATLLPILVSKKLTRLTIHSLAVICFETCFDFIHQLIPRKNKCVSKITFWTEIWPNVMHYFCFQISNQFLLLHRGIKLARNFYCPSFKSPCLCPCFWLSTEWIFDSQFLSTLDRR